MVKSYLDGFWENGFYGRRMDVWTTDEGHPKHIKYYIHVYVSNILKRIPDKS